MRVLVAYASKHGATAAIAERIATRLAAGGHDAEAQPVQTAADPAGFDAVVLGSAVYLTHWQKEALDFVRRHRAALAARPVWLFSSGPLGEETTDDEGRDLREVAQPKETAELQEAIHPRGRQVFFGVLDPETLGLRDRLIRALPAGKALLPEGDFRDWPAIDRWADDIAAELAGASGA